MIHNNMYNIFTKDNKRFSWHNKSCPESAASGLQQIAASSHVCIITKISALLPQPSNQGWHRRMLKWGFSRLGLPGSQQV